MELAAALLFIAVLAGAGLIALLIALYWLLKRRRRK